MKKNFPVLAAVAALIMSVSLSACGGPTGEAHE